METNILCIHIRVGPTSRVFQMRLDNGVELIAKIPFPTAGPAHFTTASEVATLDFLHTEAGMKNLPVVRAWSSRANSNPVGVEYILYESTLDLRPRRPLGLSPAKAPIFLPGLPFAQIGNIYYAEDVSSSLRSKPMFLPSISPSPNARRFVIGPTVDRRFWRGNRAHMSLDRGPCAWTVPFLKYTLT